MDWLDREIGDVTTDSQWATGAACADVVLLQRRHSRRTSSPAPRCRPRAPRDLHTTDDTHYIHVHVQYTSPRKSCERTCHGSGRDARRRDSDRRRHALAGLRERNGADTTRQAQRNGGRHGRCLLQVRWWRKRAVADASQRSVLLPVLRASRRRLFGETASSRCARLRGCASVHAIEVAIARQRLLLKSKPQS